MRELRGDIKTIRSELSGLREQVTKGGLQTRIWMLVLVGTVLTVMAHGFKWI